VCQIHRLDIRLHTHPTHVPYHHTV
jgi:hypothetical protein